MRENITLGFAVQTEARLASSHVKILSHCDFAIDERSKFRSVDHSRKALGSYKISVFGRFHQLFLVLPLLWNNFSSNY